MENNESRLSQEQGSQNEILYKDNELANRLAQAVLTVNFGEGRRVAPIFGADNIAELAEAGLAIDYRVLLEAGNGVSSVSEGLAFDSENVRSQSYIIYENEKPIGSMSFLVAPKKWIQRQRYFQKNDDGIGIADARAVTGSDFPDFYIIPGWAQVLDSHRGHLAISGFRAFSNAIKTIEEAAPEGTWMEAVAEGQLPYEYRGKSMQLARAGIGAVISYEKFPFDVNIMGLNSAGSASTVKMARSLGLAEAKNVYSPSTLGPVFAKRVR